MKLNVLERITALGIMPEAGNFVTLRIMNDLREGLGFTEAELKEFNIQYGQGKNKDQITWDAKGLKEEREIKIGEKATDILVETLKNLDKEKKLTNQHFTLYEKFIK